MPDGYQDGWHHVGMGGTFELLAAYGAILLIAVLVAAAVWFAHRRDVRRRAPIHRWPTASLASPSRGWGRPEWPADEGRLRASHADRDRGVALLRQATGDGYLTLDEFEDRLGKVYSARYLRDLDEIVDDIPGHPRAEAIESAHGGARPPLHGWGRRPLPVRGLPAASGAWIVFALLILAVGLQAWWLPFWPVLLIVFLVLRTSRHHRRGAEGHWR